MESWQLFQPSENLEICWFRIIILFYMTMVVKITKMESICFDLSSKESTLFFLIYIEKNG